MASMSFLWWGTFSKHGGHWRWIGKLDLSPDFSWLFCNCVYIRKFCWSFFCISSFIILMQFCQYFFRCLDLWLRFLVLFSSRGLVNTRCLSALDHWRKSHTWNIIKQVPKNHSFYLFIIIIIANMIIIFTLILVFENFSYLSISRFAVVDVSWMFWTYRVCQNMGLF